MNRLFRLMHILLFSRFRSKMNFLSECATPFRVWPTDLDVLMHMNNGMYLSLQDLARMDYMIRVQAADAIAANGWYPVVASEMIRFRRSLKPFAKFEILTRLISWDDRYLYLEHKFKAGGELVALGMIRARFLKKSGGAVSPQELVQAIGSQEMPPPFPRHLQEWLAADQSHSKALGL